MKLWLTVYSFFIFLFLSAQTNTWQWDWARTAKQHDASPSAYGTCVAIDRNNNVFAAGIFLDDSITFGAITLHKYATSTEQQIYLVKYDSVGNVLWAKSGIGALGQWVTGISTDYTGNVYLAGQFGSAALIFEHDTIYMTGYIGYYDGYIVKFNPSGSVLWAKDFGGTYFDGIDQVKADPSGNIYLAGFFRSDSVIFGGVVLYDSTFSGNSNTAFIKCDSLGNVIWAKSSPWGAGLAIAPDPFGNVVFSGDFLRDTINFGSFRVISSAPGSPQYFMVKYDKNGNPIWAQNVGIVSPVWGISNTLSSDTFGNSFITGDFSTDSVILGGVTLYGDAFSDDYFFIEKFDTAGRVLWARGANTPASGYGLATDSSNNTYVTGYYAAPSIKFGNFTLNNSDSATSGGHIFIVKYDPYGNVLNAIAAGGDGADYPYYMGLDAYGNACITGLFTSDSVAFGSTTLFNSSGNSYTPFVAKLNSGPPPLSISAAKTGICPGDSIEICADIGFASYQWNNGDTGRCIFATNEGNYVVSAYNAFNQWVSSNQLIVSIYPTVPVTLSVSNDTLSCYPANAYQWYLNNNILPGDTSMTLVAPQSGNYSVEITDTYGCNETSADVYIAATGLNEIKTGAEILVFPNPSTGSWQLAVVNELVGSMAKIYDVTGKLIWQIQINNSQTKLGPPVSAGVYLLGISGSNGYITEKLIKL